MAYSASGLTLWTMNGDGPKLWNYSTTDAIGTVNSCLLYTSPSPRDRTRSRMPSSA